MKEAGIKGTGNGAGRFLPLKLESRVREVYPKGVNLYSELPDGIKIMGSSSVRYPHSKSGYLNYLIKGVRCVIESGEQNTSAFHLAGLVPWLVSRWTSVCRGTIP